MMTHTLKAALWNLGSEVCRSVKWASELGRGSLNLTLRERGGTERERERERERQRETETETEGERESGEYHIRRNTENGSS